MEFKDKKIGILGLGEENVELVKFLVSNGANDITLLDVKSEDQLTNYLRQLENINYKTKFGEFYLDNLTQFDILFRTPGLHYLTKEIQEAKKAGVEISSQTKLFFSLCPCPIIGVTGTKGKGTTSTLIYEILKKSRQDVFLGGNIGNAPIAFFDKLTPESIVVLELSSFQIQDLTKSPHIAIVLNISSDHLDVHKDNEEYIEAKTNIVAHQNKKDFACINADYLTSFEFASQTPAEIYWFSRKKSVDRGVWIKNKTEVLWENDDNQELIIKTSDIFLKGEHNWENVAAASLAAKLTGVENEVIKETVKGFTGLEHRLEFVVEHKGVKFYNDSFSTNPDTAIAAIQSFKEPIILIAGGSEKNADYFALGEAIANSNVKTLIAIGETGSRIKNAVMVNNAEVKIIDNCQNLDEVLNKIQREMVSGDVVLLSPASASFDWFLNYKDRGEQFKEKVLNLEN